MLKICKNCKQEKEHHARGFCYTCYKKLFWSPRSAKCKRCQKTKPLHAKGLCGSCYNFVYRLDKNKAWNYKKYHNLNQETYKKITSKCVLCEFDKIVEIHHLDENKQNNFQENLIGLCPNHHKMLHNFEFRKQILDELKEKGYKVIEDPKIEFEIRKEV